MSLFESLANRFTNIVNLQGLSELNDLYFDVDPPKASSQVVEVGQKSLETHTWRSEHGREEIFDLGLISSGDGTALQVTGHLYAGLSVRQYDLVKMQIEAVHAADSWADSPLYVRQAEAITGSLQGESVVIMVSIDQDQSPSSAIGYLNIGPVDPTTEARQIGILVLKTFRKQQIAKKLFAYVLEYAVELNLKKFWVNFESENHGVINFLEMIKREFAIQIEVDVDTSDPHTWNASLRLINFPS